MNYWNPECYSWNRSSERNSPSESYQLARQCGIGMDKYPDQISDDTVSDDDVELVDEFDDFLLGMRDDGEFQHNYGQDLSESIDRYKDEGQISSPFFEFRPLDSSVSPLTVEILDPLRVIKEPCSQSPLREVEPLDSANTSVLDLSSLDDSLGLLETAESQRFQMPTTEVLTSNPSQDEGIYKNFNVPEIEAQKEFENLGAVFCFECGMVKHTAACLTEMERYTRESSRPPPRRLTGDHQALEQKLFLREVISKWDDLSWFREVARKYKARYKLVAPSSPPPQGGGQRAGIVQAPYPELVRDWKPVVYTPVILTTKWEKFPLQDEEVLDQPKLVDISMEPNKEVHLPSQIRSGHGVDRIYAHLPNSTFSNTDVSQADQAVLYIMEANKPPSAWSQSPDAFVDEVVDERPRRIKLVRFEEYKTIVLYDDLD